MVKLCNHERPFHISYQRSCLTLTISLSEPD